MAESDETIPMTQERLDDNDAEIPEFLPKNVREPKQSPIASNTEANKLKAEGLQLKVDSMNSAIACETRLEGLLEELQLKVDRMISDNACETRLHRLLDELQLKVDRIPIGGQLAQPEQWQDAVMSNILSRQRQRSHVLTTNEPNGWAYHLKVFVKYVVIALAFMLVSAFGNSTIPIHCDLWNLVVVATVVVATVVAAFIYASMLP